jgi:amino acid adenylation domain-containing protein
VPEPRTIVRSKRAEDNRFEPGFNFRPFHLDDAESTIAARFQDVVRRRKNATAVVHGETSVTYEELLERATLVAATLQSRITKADGTVGIAGPLSSKTVEVILGVLLAGFSYFCIEWSMPDSQVAGSIAAAGPCAVVGDETTCRRLKSICPAIQAALVDWNALSSVHAFRAAKVTPNDAAALYATSGSTGEPKLVSLSHRAILFDIGRQTNDLYLGEADRFDSLFSFAFSASLAPMFGALLNGGELHLFDVKNRLNHLPEWLAERQITISTMTVSMLRAFCLSMQAHCRFPDLRLLSVGGEPLLGSDVEAFRSVFGAGCTLQNAMAATETRTYSQYFVPRAGAVENPVPIGWPVLCKDVVLVGDNHEPVASGEEGQIAIRSRYLADGYANDTPRTQEKFIVDGDGTVLYLTGDRGRALPDGKLVFLGRGDTMTKVRGYRVELQEIEHLIHQHPSVREAAVVVREDIPGDGAIVAYLVITGERDTVLAGLAEMLKQNLPLYMMPTLFVTLDTLPLNTNNKVDRRHLPPPVTSPAGINERSHADSSPTTLIVRDIWAEILRTRGFGNHDSFYDAGGNSLRTLRLVLKLNEHFNTNFGPDIIWRHPTVYDFSKLLDQGGSGISNQRPLICFQSGESRPPIFFVPGIGGSVHYFERVARRLGPDQPSYGFSPRRDLGNPATGSIEAIAADYVSEILSIMPCGRLVLVGHSFGGTVAFEMARQLEAGAYPRPVIVIVDIAATNVENVKGRTLARKVIHGLLNLPCWSVYGVRRCGPKGFLAEIGRKFQAALDPGARSCFEPMLDTVPDLESKDIPTPYFSFTEAMLRIFAAYVPKRYSGKVILLRANVPTLFRTRDPKMGWQRIAEGGVDVHSVPGNHATCLEDAHWQDFTTVLEQLLGKEQRST